MITAILVGTPAVTRSHPRSDRASRPLLRRALWQLQRRS